MTKYEEIVDSANQAFKQWWAWRDRCYRDLDDFVQGFIRHCQIPITNVSLLPLDREPEERMRYNVIGASHLGDDSYWHVGVCIALPLQRILIRISLTETAGKTFVKLSDDGKPIEIDVGDQNQCADLYNQIVEDIKHYYIAEPKFGESTAKIGFIVQDASPEN
jgi:hypothetical protein